MCFLFLGAEFNSSGTCVLVDTAYISKSAKAAQKLMRIIKWRLVIAVVAFVFLLKVSLLFIVRIKKIKPLNSTPKSNIYFSIFIYKSYFYSFSFMVYLPKKKNIILKESNF